MAPLLTEVTTSFAWIKNPHPSSLTSHQSHPIFPVFSFLLFFSLRFILSFFPSDILHYCCRRQSPNGTLPDSLGASLDDETMPPSLFRFHNRCVFEHLRLTPPLPPLLSYPQVTCSLLTTLSRLYLKLLDRAVATKSMFSHLQVFDSEIQTLVIEIISEDITQQAVRVGRDEITSLLRVI